MLLGQVLGHVSDAPNTVPTLLEEPHHYSRRSSVLLDTYTETLSLSSCPCIMTTGGLAMLLSDPAKRPSDDVAGVAGVMLARFESG
jgi:hypothetical protein